MSSLTLKNTLYTCCPRPLRPYWKRIEASDLGYRLVRGAFWSLAGAVISRGLMLLASIFVARMLGKEGFGELGIIRSTVVMFGSLAGFGLGLTTTKHVAEFRKSHRERAGRIIALSGLVALATGCLMALMLLILAPWLATQTLNAPQLRDLLRIGSLLLLLNALNGAQTGVLAGFEAFRTIARVNLLVGLASFPILVGGAYLGGLRGAVWGLTLNLAIHWMLNHLALRREAALAGVPVAFRGCTQEWCLLWAFSLPAALSTVMIGPAFWACGAMLVNQPHGYAEMGVFNAANQWRIAILFIPASVGQIVLPMLSSLNAQEDQSRYRKVFKYTALLNGGIACLIAAPIALLAPVIMASYGEGFEVGALALVLLSLSSVLMAANNVVGQAIVSKGRMWIGFAFNGLWAITLVTASAAFIRQGYGAAGLALANLVAYLLHSLWQSTYLIWLGRNTAWEATR